MGARSVPGASCALEVGVSWQGSVLASDSVAWQEKYVLHDGTARACGRELVLPRAWVDEARSELAQRFGDGSVRVEAEQARAPALVLHAEGGQVVAQLREGAAQLVLGREARLKVGAVEISVRAAESVPGTAPWRRSEFSVRRGAPLFASFAAHAVVLACMALMPPRASSLSLDHLSEDARYARYLATPLYREEVLPFPESEGHGAGEDAARHEGDEGRAVALEPTARRQRPTRNGGQPGEQTPRVRPDQVSEQGLLGALSAANRYVAESSPYGLGDSFGYDPRAALLALMGEDPGTSAGMGGLGLRHAGRGGGGDARGAIGLDGLDTGRFRASAPRATAFPGSTRRTHIPLVRTDHAEVLGSLSKEVIRRAIHARLNEVRFCYSEALRARPELAGRVTVRFVIASSGAVQSAAIQNSALDHAGAERCIAEAVRRFTFPAPEGGGYVSVTYPFVFEAAGE